MTPAPVNRRCLDGARESERRNQRHWLAPAAFLRIASSGTFSTTDLYST